MTKKMSSQNKGFSLIELMVVISILGILVTLARPAAQNYYIRSKRAEFTVALRSLTLLAHSASMEYTKMPWGDGVTVRDTETRSYLGLPATSRFRYNIDNSGSGAPFYMPILLGIGNDGSGSDRDELLGVPGYPPVWICQDKTTGLRISAATWAANYATLPPIGAQTAYGMLRTFHRGAVFFPCRDGGGAFSF